MDMSWQALLQEAAATSFEKTADTLAAAENDNCACIDLHQQQIHELSKKILLLPHQGRVLLLSRYCFRLSPEETEMFFHLENAKGRFRFYKELLSSSIGVEAGCMISDDTFVKACHIALKGYLHNELEADADDEAAGNNWTHIAFRHIHREEIPMVHPAIQSCFSELLHPEDSQPDIRSSPAARPARHRAIQRCCIFQRFRLPTK